MSREIIQFDQGMFESKLDAMVREKVERIVNAMPDASGGRDRQRREIRAFRRTEGVPGRPLRAEPDRQGRQARAQGAEIEGRPVRVRGDRTLPQTRGKRRGGADRHVPGRRVHQACDDTGQLPWGDRMPSQALSDKLKRVYAEIDEWRTRPLEGEYPYVFVDGVWHKRSWGGSVENVGILVAIGTSKDGHREAVGVAEGMREDSASWERFFRGMIERGLKGVRLVVDDRCTGLVATVDSMLPKARDQRRMVRFLRNVLSKVPPSHREWASAALKAVFAMESCESTLDKADAVASDMKARRLKAAANCLREGVGETTTYLLDEFPDGHRRRIRTNNMIERPDREIRRRTRVVGGFPDGNSALMLICARIRHVTANEWSTRRYLDMSRLGDNLVEAN